MVCKVWGTQIYWDPAEPFPSLASRKKIYPVLPVQSQLSKIIAQSTLQEQSVSSFKGICICNARTGGSKGWDCKPIENIWTNLVNTWEEEEERAVYTLIDHVNRVWEIFRTKQRLVWNIVDSLLNAIALNKLWTTYRLFTLCTTASHPHFWGTAHNEAIDYKILYNKHRPWLISCYMYKCTWISDGETVYFSPVLFFKAHKWASIV